MCIRDRVVCRGFLPYPYPSPQAAGCAIQPWTDSSFNYLHLNTLSRYNVISRHYVYMAHLLHTPTKSIVWVICDDQWRLWLCASCVSVCLCPQRKRKTNRATNTKLGIDTQCVAVARHALTPKSKCQDHSIIRRAVVVDMYFDMTVCFGF